LLPALALGQGIRMAPDFLPLDVGNLWRYDVVDEEGNQAGTLEFRIDEFSIVDGTSFYVFDRFPFSPSLEVNRPVGIRFDQQNRQFVWFDGANQADLFPSLGATAEVLETDENGLPIRAMFRFGSMVLTLERGIGITQAGFRVAEGLRVASLIAARVSGDVLGVMDSSRAAPSAGPEPLDVAEPIGETTTPEEVAPELTVEVIPERDFHRFILTLRNPSQQLMPFDFTSSQSFDFVVVDPSHGQEIWRWSLRRFFSEVLRSEAVRAGGDWTFEGEWTYRDNALNEVEPGIYEVYGILAAENPVESESVRFEVE
jgi:hypothetical protein